ncbi:chromate transporter, partial [Agrobacterium tumefaciens]|uniref:chromate transporter n=1 Tax=Agrobacterium tumefaciens TaxID=358 RepID=UPI0030137262
MKSSTRTIETEVRSQRHGTPGEVFAAFLKLGVTSFGGPIAHLGYFRDELVVRRKWIDEAGYADLVALCQFLPGPASSQVGFALGNLQPFEGLNVPSDKFIKIRNALPVDNTEFPKT